MTTGGLHGNVSMSRTSSCLDFPKMNLELGCCIGVCIPVATQTYQCQQYHEYWLLAYAVPCSLPLVHCALFMLCVQIIYFTVASNFFSYTSGVYSPSGCTDRVNHAMVVEGYKWTGALSTSYWIVRNSWGSGWGESGYVRIRMTGDNAGPCQMQTYPHAPALTFSKLPSVL